jgi:hypothetical protein
MRDARHCDDYIDDLTQPKCLRDFLEFKRSPATEQLGKSSPPLFANTKGDLTGHAYLGDWSNGKPNMRDVPIPAGQRVRVVMASRFGDVGIGIDLNAEHGYLIRLAVEDLTNFGDTP